MDSDIKPNQPGGEPNDSPEPMDPSLSEALKDLDNPDQPEQSEQAGESDSANSTDNADTTEQPSEPEQSDEKPAEESPVVMPPSHATTNPLDDRLSALDKISEDGSVPGFMAPAKKSKKSLIITIVLVVLLLGAGGAAGWFFMQNQDTSDQLSQKDGEINKLNNDIANLNQQITTLQNAANENNTEEEQSTEPPVVDTGATTQYFTVTEWNVRFILPTGLKASDLEYTIESADGIDLLNIRSKTVMAFGGVCAQFTVGTVGRTTVAPDPTASSAGASITNFGGNYYSFSGPQDSCLDGSNAANTATLADKSNLVRAMAFSLMSTS
jgi:hypothetical protein